MVARHVLHLARRARLQSTQARGFYVWSGNDGFLGRYLLFGCLDLGFFSGFPLDNLVLSAGSLCDALFYL